MQNIFKIIMVFLTIDGAFAIEFISSDINSSELRDERINVTEERDSLLTKEIKVRDSGIERSIIVPLPDPNLGATLLDEENPLLLKKGLIIKFIDENINIEEFSSLFDIELEEKLVIGYYIFKNTSSVSDVKLIEAILNSESKDDIKTIRPNWKMKNKVF